MRGRARGNGAWAGGTLLPFYGSDEIKFRIGWRSEKWLNFQKPGAEGWGERVGTIEAINIHLHACGCVCVCLSVRVCMCEIDFWFFCSASGSGRRSFPPNLNRKIYFWMRNAKLKDEFASRVEHQLPQSEGRRRNKQISCHLLGVNFHSHDEHSTQRT